jgi:predicted dehydrogenase
MDSSLKRRDFLKATGAIGLASLANGGAAFAANEKVVVAVVGLHSRGKNLIEGFAGYKNSEVKYVVDVDTRYFGDALKKAAEFQKKKPDTLQDFRKALDDKDIDAIAIAAPDHWHTPMAIMALQAGKHVYVEKPCGHNPAEGELLIKAQEKYGLKVQMGNQRRSLPVCQQMIQEIKDGLIGNVYYANTWYTNNRAPIGFGKEVAIPDSLDFELWQGPAPRTAYRSNIHPYNWHWFWRWGTGEALNNGTHEIDVARWALGVDFPVRVTSAGGRYHYVGKDDWEAYDTQTISIEFEEGKCISWEGRSCSKYTPHGDGRGVTISGSEGAIEYLSDRYTVFDNAGKLVKEVGKGAKADTANTSDPGLKDNHQGNLVDAIRGEAKVNSPIQEGHKSVLLCQLGNIALRSGSMLNIDPKNGHIIKNKEAQKLWSREYEPGWEPKV